jgi:alpha/beta superfamily hydrolase
MIAEEVSFSNKNIKLYGTLYKPETNFPYPVVVIVHPASDGERSNPFFDHLKFELPKHGIAAFIFDRRGSGQSEGNFATADFEDLAGDVISAVEYLQTRTDVDKTKIGLHGTSQGGWVAPIAAARKTDIAFIIEVSASGVSPADQMNYGVAFHLKQDGFKQSTIDQAIELRNFVNEYFRGHISRDKVANELRRFETEPWYQKAYLSPSQKLPVNINESKWYYEMDYEPLSIWNNVKQPTLFLFAEIDEWVPIDQSMTNYKNVVNHLHDVTFKQIEGTNHLMSVSGNENEIEISSTYLDILIDWLTSRKFGN